jgi:hypothetical protein
MKVELARLTFASSALVPVLGGENVETAVLIEPPKTKR